MAAGAVLTPVTALTTWQFVPLVSVPLALCAALYLAGTRTVARRHPVRPWPRTRTAAFLAGLASVAAAVCGSYLLLLAAMPADIATGAFLMLSGPIGGYGPADVHDAGIIMLGGSELIMTALAVLLAVNLLRSPVGREKAFGLAEYNASLALLEARLSDRARSSAQPGHHRPRG